MVYVAEYMLLEVQALQQLFSLRQEGHKVLDVEDKVSLILLLKALIALSCPMISDKFSGRNNSMMDFVR
mgnify:CR=1 FL=1